jgi:hypothetical protein
MPSPIIRARPARPRTFATLYLWTLVVVATLLSSTTALADTHYTVFARFVPGPVAAENQVLSRLNAGMEVFRQVFMTNASRSIVSSEIVADYCFARSRLLAGALESVEGVEVVAHLQIDLALRGEGWTYHVAPVIRLGGRNGPVFVADSINGYRTIPQWANDYGSNRLRMVHPGGPAHDGAYYSNNFTLNPSSAESTARGYEVTNWMEVDSEEVAQVVDAARVLRARDRLRVPNARMADVYPAVESEIAATPADNLLPALRTHYPGETKWLLQTGAICRAP